MKPTWSGDGVHSVDGYPHATQIQQQAVALSQAGHREAAGRKAWLAPGPFLTQGLDTRLDTVP